MSSNTSYTRTVRWRNRHPERKREIEAAYRENERILRARYPHEWSDLLSAEDGSASGRRRAMKALRENHPDEWAEILAR